MGNINQYYQQLLGRNATPDEQAYLQKFIDEGYLQGDEVGQIIQSMPEFQQKRLTQDTEAYGQRLQANDEAALRRGADIAGAQAASRFAQLGRPNSSALAAQVFGQTGNMAQNLANQRQSMLAEFYGRGLNQNASLQQRLGQGALDRGYGQRDATTQYNRDMSMYNRQQNDYNNYLNQANRQQRERGFASLAGAGLGAAIGSYGGMPGAQLGAGLGSKLGGLF